MRSLHFEIVALSAVVALTIMAGCATTGPQASQDSSPAWDAQASWPELFRQSGSLTCGAAAAAVPVPKDMKPALLDALAEGAVTLAGRRVQAQTVAVWPESDGPRRAILRWIDSKPETALTGVPEISPTAQHDAGWSFGYTLVEGNTENLTWIMTTRNLPLEKTQYEMYRLNLGHEGRELGLRLGLRHNDRIYWWQFVRADFIHRGPVCDILRAGGPIYNEQNTVQGDLYLVLYANGVIEATAHFINHRREGPASDVNGVPVIGFDIPEAPEVDVTLDGRWPEFALGGVSLNLGQTVHMADAERPGSLRTEEGVVVLQPWLDQQIYGVELVYDEGVPEHRIIRREGTTGQLKHKDDLGAKSHRWYVTTIGDELIPSGVARSFRFTASLGDARAEVLRYQAPGWWHALCGALPTRGMLPVSWWAVPRALKTSESCFSRDGNCGPFEYGRSVRDGDGSAGAAMLTLGHALGIPRFCEEAIPCCYWRADIPINHVDFYTCELPYFGWQWVVQPYARFMSAVHGYWETGDPYLLETAELAADGYYRFYAINRPHRFVGRDSLPLFGLFDLYRTTGYRFYLDRIRRVLRDARDSYSQTSWYWPGHQSGCGPNGVARQESYVYIPAVLARFHADLLECAGERLAEEERAASLDFMRRMMGILLKKKNEGDENWYKYTSPHLYITFTELAEEFPEEARDFGLSLNEYNALFGTPESHSGDKVYTWVSGALRFDSWAWGPIWRDGTLYLHPQAAALGDTRAPKEARIFTPAGVAEVAYDNGEVAVVRAPCPVCIE